MALTTASVRDVPRHVIWLMGPTSSGKTTIAELLLKRLREDGGVMLHYDGDEVRDFFGDGLGFEAADRLRVVSTLTHLVNKSTAAGIIVRNDKQRRQDQRSH